MSCHADGAALAWSHGCRKVHTISGCAYLPRDDFLLEMANAAALEGAVRAYALREHTLMALGARVKLTPFLLFQLDETLSGHLD